jgi:predicted ATPase
LHERYVLTGPPGGGKTPLLAELVALGFTGVREAARAVLAEQRAIDGDGVYERNRQLFFDLMLERAVRDHTSNTMAFFDRGIVDLIAYARIFELDPSTARRAAETHRYAEPVFFLPSWKEIYTTDDERKMTFEQAAVFGDLIRSAYLELGYNIVDVPKDTPLARGAFVSKMLNPGS